MNYAFIYFSHAPLIVFDDDCMSQPVVPTPVFFVIDCPNDTGETWHCCDEVGEETDDGLRE